MRRPRVCRASRNLRSFASIRSSCAIERVREDVDVHAFVRARQFRGRNQRDAFRIGVRLDLEIRGEVVVIADGHDLDPVRAARRRSPPPANACRRSDRCGCAGRRSALLHRRLLGHDQVHDHLIASRAQAAVFDDFLAVLPAASALFAAGGRHGDADRAEAFDLDRVASAGVERRSRRARR